MLNQYVFKALKIRLMQLFMTCFVTSAISMAPFILDIRQLRGGIFYFFLYIGLTAVFIILNFYYARGSCLAGATIRNYFIANIAAYIIFALVSLILYIVVHFFISAIPRLDFIYYTLFRTVMIFRYFLVDTVNYQRFFSETVFEFLTIAAFHAIMVLAFMAAPIGLGKKMKKIREDNNEIIAQADNTIENLIAKRDEERKVAENKTNEE